MMLTKLAHILFFIATTTFVFAESVLMVGFGISPTNWTEHANCVGAWYLNADGSTAESDRSGNSLDLAVKSTETIPQSSTIPSGYSGYSRDFETSDEDMLWISDASCGGLDINGSSALITVCAWVRLESAPSGGSYMWIASKHGDDGYRQYGLTVYDASGTTRARFIVSNDGSATGSSISTSGLSTATWYHLCGVYDDTNTEIWVDGSREAYDSFAASTIYNSGTRFEIGARDTTGSSSTAYFDGLIDEVIVFNIALNSTQINEIKDYGISGNKGGSD
jgi:hypothetical protein